LLALLAKLFSIAHERKTNLLSRGIASGGYNVLEIEEGGEIQSFNMPVYFGLSNKLKKSYPFSDSSSFFISVDL